MEEVVGICESWLTYEGLFFNVEVHIQWWNRNLTHPIWSTCDHNIWLFLYAAVSTVIAMEEGKTTHIGGESSGTD